MKLSAIRFVVIACAHGLFLHTDVNAGNEANRPNPLRPPHENAFVDVRFTTPPLQTNAFVFQAGGLPRIAIIQEGAKWNASEKSLKCGELGAAILPRSSAIWSELGRQGSIEIVFRFTQNLVKKRQALFTFGPVMTWPSIFVMVDGAPRVTVLFPTKVEPVAWSTSVIKLETGKWHTVFLCFSVEKHQIVYAVNDEKPVWVTNDDFHTRTTFFENIYLGSSGSVPLMSHTIDPFEGEIRSLRVWKKSILEP
jgi:hypothetical protein